MEYIAATKILFWKIFNNMVEFLLHNVKQEKAIATLYLWCVLNSEEKIERKVSKITVVWLWEMDVSFLNYLYNF